eukprot:GFUD01023898.1.p1 GENE.GFUD01023898.1~~GFUD01023898.1.p1  ORF type:complete len:639 (+),score=170.92 GFUD01023898.1:81-1997(+)
MISSCSLSKVRTLFQQCVSLSFAVAFHSFYTQIPGLYGDQGVLPARSVLDTSRLLKENFVDLVIESPTLLWVTPLTGLSLVQLMEVFSLVGIMIGLVITAWPAVNIKISLAILWVLYLSLFQVGQTFLGFQWDILLLETGFLAIICSPMWPNNHSTSLAWDQITMYLVRWLLFRMMFASGVVKLTSGCPTWWGLTAMPTHYFSQCLPTPLAWYAALMPNWMHKLSVVSTFVIEIPMSFLFFAPTSSLRKFTFFNQVFLMVVIMLSGNYNFFNFLYIALCLSLSDNSWLTTNPAKKSHPITYCSWCLLHLAAYLGMGWVVGQVCNFKLNPDLSVDSSLAFTSQDFDTFLSYAVPGGIYAGGFGLLLACLFALKEAFSQAGKLGKVRSVLTVVLYCAVAAGMFGLSLPSYSGQLDRATYDRVPRELKNWDRRLDRLQLTSSYGLFRRMTGVGGRPEVIIEGSDQLHGPWKEYEFLYKPGNISRAPTFMLPHQPRLDWQMWFAALGSYQHNPWFISMVFRLLEGRPEVLQLLDPESPFANRNPPKYIRAKLYKYHFTQGGKDWWSREEQGEYMPILTKDHKPLIDFLTNQGILGLTPEKTSVVATKLLDSVRSMTTLAPPHIQIWSYAWVVLPMFKPFLLS